MSHKHRHNPERYYDDEGEAYEPALGDWEPFMRGAPWRQAQDDLRQALDELEVGDR